jgi:methionyl-tRNA synthetase
MQEIEQNNNVTTTDAAGESSEAKAAPVEAATSKVHTSKLRSVIDGLAVALAESNSESNAVVAFENAIQDSITGGSEPGASAPAATAPAPIAPASSEKITIDDFAKIELRVAQIKVAERVPKADKLLRLEVDLGYEQRQILAGIAEAYTPESLIGRKVVIVANLAPRKLRGLESNGMIVAASVEGGKAVLAGFLEDIEIGARLK